MVIFEDCRFAMFIGYIQNNEDKAEQAHQYQQIQSFAKDNNLKLECIYTDYAFADIKAIIMSDCKGIIICNISALGDGLSQIKDNLLFCQQLHIRVYSIEDGYHFDESNLTEDFFKGVDIAIEIRSIKGVDIAIEIRSNLISQNTKKVLKQRKNEGVKLGRPFGAVVKKRLDGKEDEIRKLLSQKVSKAEIARRFNVTRITVFNFIKRNGLENKASSQGNIGRRQRNTPISSDKEHIKAVIACL